jgi:hypothetical protein
MKQDEMLHRHFEILSSLSYIPRKILALHGNENITEFVLHELCNEHCFNFNKAAYLVDNPDFDCLKGVAGFSRSETKNSKDIWQDPRGFSKDMELSPFNKKVRSLMRCSLKKNNENSQELATSVAQDLGIKSFGFCSWGMKHENHGMLVFEKMHDEAINEDHLLNGLSLLSFCPIF